jgi:hypothetical protein
MTTAVDIDARRRALAERCAAVARAAGEGIEWFRTNPERAPDQLAGLERDVRRMRARAEKLRLASLRPMCVTVFGASQSGKSYLISALARPAGAPLSVQIGSRTYDFLEEINPFGDKESTGLVTRFSLDKVASPVADLPVCVRLLSQSDVIRIIANGYMEEISRDAAQPVAPGRLEQLFGELTPGKASSAGLTEDDVYEMREYFERYFRSHPVIAAVGSEYWREAAGRAQRLDAGQRAKLFAPLWGETTKLTALCARLLGALEALGNPDETFCEVAALIPRQESIIDVQMLMKGLEDDAASKVQISTAEGRRIALPRPLVAALVAELRLTLAAAPRTFSSDVDLLDFPGAMARSQFSGPADTGYLYRRGKIAYLFQRYVADQELAAMVLCVDQGNQQVKTLPTMVKEWIDATHGGTPEERAKVTCGLFVGLTKFDMEFAMGPGKRDDEPGRWNTRLHTVFTEFLCQEHAWHDEWRTGSPFNNVFWLRNPGIKQPLVVAYDEHGEENDLADAPRLARLRALYLETSQVQRHFADPAKAWDEALRLNDGGVAYLADSLRPVCNPQIKLDQIGARLAALALDLRRRLEPFHISSDAVKEQARRAKDIAQTQARLREIAASKRFGLLILQLQIPRGGLLRPFLRVQAEKQITIVDGRSLDHPHWFAAAALEEWNAIMRALAGREDLETAIGLDRETAQILVRILAAIASHIGLRERVAARIRPHYVTQAGARERVRTPALIAEMAVNDFVAALGFTETPKDVRPRLRRKNGQESPIFWPNGADGGAEAYVEDWRHGFAVAGEAAAEGPVLSAKEREANEALGLLIAELPLV